MLLQHDPFKRLVATFVLLAFYSAASAAPLYNIVPLGFDDPEHTFSDGHKSSYANQLNEAGQVIGRSYRRNGVGPYLGQSFSAWLYNGASTINIGLTGPEHTRSNGDKYSIPEVLNEAGQVSGLSERYNGGSIYLGYSAWLYNGAATIDIGLTGPEYTRSDGRKFSRASDLNEVGQVIGGSIRYNGSDGSINLGSSAWIYNGTTTIPIGFTGPEYTSNDGYKASGAYAYELNDAGQVIGYSNRYNGGSIFSNPGRSAWLYDGATTIELGFTGTEYTRNDGYKFSSADGLNEAGQVIGVSERYNGGSTQPGQSAWLYNGTSTIELGFTGPEYTRSDGYKSSYAWGLNDAGQVTGSSARYNGSSTFLGVSAWLYNRATTIDIGLTGPEHTRNDGFKSSFPPYGDLNEAGQVIGVSNRYNGGSTQLGYSAWLYNGATTVNIGLTGPEHTRNDGYKYSYVSGYQLLNEAGQVIGVSNRYNGGYSQKGQDAWFYDPLLDQTFALQLSTRSDGYAYSSASYLGEDGLVLGTYRLFDALNNDLGDRAFYFTIADGLHDLGFFVDDGLAANGWDYLASAIRANSRGQIIGYGILTSGSAMAYLLTPIVVPEPSTCLLAVAALGLCIARRRRARNDNPNATRQARRRQQLSIVHLLSTIISLFICAAASAAPLYNIVPLGLDDPEHTRSDGYKYSAAGQLNEAGQALGGSLRYNGGSADLGRSAWLYDGATTIKIGLTGPEHTKNDGYKFSGAQQLNQAGQVRGYSDRFKGGSTNLGRSVWLYDGATTIDIGFTGAEYTRNDGYKYSSAVGLNEAGQVPGFSYRYNGGSTSLGASAWLYNGTTTIDIGLTGSEHTRNDGYKHSFEDQLQLNEAGQVRGRSDRYNGGSTALGYSAWLYDGATTIDIGLTGPEHTRNDGYKSSLARYLNEAGQVSGNSQRYNGGSADLGRSAWLYNGATTIDIGLVDAEHTGYDGYRDSEPKQLNHAGQVSGYSRRYNGGSAILGFSAWLYDGATTIDVGLTGSEHTRYDGLKSSGSLQLNKAGQVAGLSGRYNGGSTDLGLSAWLYNGATTIDIGLTGPEHTSSNGYKFSYPGNSQYAVGQMNEAGQVIGYSERYNGGSANLGRSAWLYNGTTTIDIGLAGPEHTSNDGLKYSFAGSEFIRQPNEAGQVTGFSQRYNGGSAHLGQSAWLYDGTTTVSIGLTGPEHTRNDGYKTSLALKLNEAGQVTGGSTRYNGGSTELGLDSWLYDPALHQTFALNLSTRSDGYANSWVTYLGEDGLVLGTYTLFDAQDTNLGSRAFYFTIANGLHDLGLLVDGGLAANGWDYLTGATRANGRGQILGYGRRSPPGGGMPYLLTPIIPEPSALALSASALAGLLLQRRVSQRRGPCGTLIVANQHSSAARR